MHKEIVENRKWNNVEKFFRTGIYETGTPIPFIPEDITSDNELTNASIKAISSVGNAEYELIISVEGRGDTSYQIKKGSSLKMSMLLLNGSSGVHTEHVIIEIEDVSEKQVAIKVVSIEDDVEDFEDEFNQPAINLPHVYTVDETDEKGNEMPFFYQPKEVTYDAYSKLKSVSNLSGNKFRMVITCGEDEDSLNDYEYEVTEGSVLNLNICELSGNWPFGHAVLDCNVKVSDLSDGKVTLTLLEKGEENLDK